MHYKMVKMGLGEFQVDLPVESQSSLHVVGIVGLKERFLVTHVSMDEMADFTGIMKTIELRIKFDHNVPAGMPSDSYFSINNTQHREHTNGNPTCWVAWFDNNPDHLFFIPHDFCKSPHFQLKVERYGVFDVTSGEPVLKAACNANTTLREITESL